MRKRGAWIQWNHEKREWEIVIEILEDEEGGEEKIIWG